MKPSLIASDKNTLTGFFLISLTMLLFELLASRVMSATAFYHFAFMAICLALFGITVGAVIVHLSARKIAENPSGYLRLFCLIFAFSLIVHLYCIIQLQSFYISESWNLVPIRKNLMAIFISIAVPLIACGACLSLIFERYVHKANKIYFINLVGSAIGCLIFIPTINFLGVINTYLLLILICLVCAHLFQGTKLNTKYLAIISILFLMLIAGNQRFNVLDIKWVKGVPNENFFFKKWNSYSLVRLIYGGQNPPTGWSFAPKKMGEIMKMKIAQVHLDIDGGAGSSMSYFGTRDLSTLKFLNYDLTSLPYHLVKNGDVLVIGIGAGRDILTGLYFDQRSITGVEINKTIIDVHRNLLAKFNGDLSRHPKVQFINNEARSFINSSKKKFDIIQISLIDTFAATQAGAYALSENNLYTTEAIKTYWDHLNDGGMISISYWTNPYMVKIMGSATQALTQGGIATPRNHFILIHSDKPVLSLGVANILIKKTPFTVDEIETVKKYCDEMGFHFAFSPAHSMYDDFNQVSDIRRIAPFVKESTRQIAPATDDNPFFFVITRMDFLKLAQNFNLFEIKNAEDLLVSLFILMLLLSIIFVIIPLSGFARQSFSGVPVASFSAYFTAIGLAFMFVEMTQITRLSSFLGHPTYSLAVALFTFLFGSGLGSLLLGRVSDRQAMRMYIYLFLTFCLISGTFTAPFLHHYSKYPIFPRMLIAVAALFPLAFFMGTFLPQGMKLLHRQKAPVALFWGLNGAASVLGSILAMIMQIQMGLSATFHFGIGLYAIAALLLFSLEKRCGNGLQKTA